MRISANLGFLYTDLPITEAIAAAAADGFDAVEFHWPYETSAADLGAALRRAGVPGIGINTLRGDVAAGENGLTALPGRESEARAAIDKAVDYAAEAGIGAVHVMAGKATGPESERTFAANLAHAASRAADHGLTVLIEPLNSRDVPGYHLTGTGHARRVIETVGAPNLKIMYDFYHMQIMQGDHIETIRSLGPLIGHMQFASVPGRGEPDEGELDFPAIFRRLKMTDPLIGAEYLPKISPESWLVRFRRGNLD